MDVTSVSVERLEKSRVKLTIEAPPETLEEGLAISFKKNAGRFSVPGFRKGKAPRAVVERRYGAELFFEDAFEAICPVCFEKAAKDQGITPVGRPDVSIVTMEKGEPFVFTVEVAVKPEAKLGQYKGVKAPYKLEVITDDEIDARLKAEAESRARLVPVEGRPAQAGDIVVIDFEGSIDGVPFEGGRGEGRTLELGSGQFVPGFEEQIAGRSAGDEFDVEVAFPEDYGPPGIRGKAATFRVTLHSVKAKEVPVIDDDFASEASEFDTLAEMRDGIRSELEALALAKAQSQFEDAVVLAVVADSEVDIPDDMVERQYMSDMGQMEASAKASGYAGIDEYLERGGRKRADFEPRMRASAERAVRVSLVIGAVVEAEGIEATDDEVDSLLRERAARQGKGYEEYIKAIDEDARERARDSLLSAKAVGFLASNAVKEAKQ